MSKRYYLNYLEELESEAIHILREAYAQFENPVILFSGGKDVTENFNLLHSKNVLEKYHSKYYIGNLID